MKKSLSKMFLPISIAALLGGCGRDLSTTSYVSSSTFNLTLEGTVLNVRDVTIKEGEGSGENVQGALVGAGIGGVAGGIAGRSGGAALGGALIGGTIGSIAHSSATAGYEYVIKLDTSKIQDEYYEGNSAMRNVISTARAGGIVTIAQGTDIRIPVGQKVYVIYSNNRSRVIPAH